MRRLLLPSLLALPAFAWAGMSLNVAGMTIDGLEIRQLTCDVNSGGLFASMEIGAALSKQKAALDACLPGGGAYKIKWASAGGRLTSSGVDAGSDDKATPCIAGVIKALVSTSDATCSAIVLVGEPVAAKAAADKLSPTPTP